MIIHIESKANRIAELASWDEWDSAEEAVQYIGWEPTRVDISAHVKLWDEDLSAWVSTHHAYGQVEFGEERVMGEIEDIEQLEFDLHCTLQ